MPVVIESPRPEGRTRSGRLVVGLVNNMPDAALLGTEVQFKGLLAAAAGDRDVRLRLTSIPEVPRGPEAHASITERYWRIEDLIADPPDALIVTGTEPRSAALRDEPYWTRLVQLVEFAEAHTVASLWSCLAAHAAVLYLDGIERRRLPAKRFGVFGHEIQADDPLTAGLGARIRTPHSRWNDLPLGDLRGAGYGLLAVSAAGEADVFCKHRRAHFLFLQGHPEYEPRTLLKEYQRDVGRFITGEYADYPKIPPGYFDAAGVRLAQDFERAVRAGHLERPQEAFPFKELADTLSVDWSASAAGLYRNWLGLIATRKLERAAR